MASHHSALLSVLPLVLAGSAFAQGGDDCTIPTAINAVGTYALDTTVATTSGFNGTGSCSSGSNTINQDLFWQFTVPVDGDYSFDTVGSAFDTKLSVHAGIGCAAVCAGYNDDTVGLTSTVNLNGLLAGEDILVQVGGFGGSAGMGVLNISVFVDPCTTATDDAFEDNDDCGQETNMVNGNYVGLFVSKVDWDYYTFMVEDGATLQVDLSFTHADGDMDIFLYPDGRCEPFANGDVGCAETIACGFSASDNETVSWTNLTGAPQRVIAKVNIWPATSTSDCNNYDMLVSGTGFGDLYCTSAELNSTGSSATINAFGSITVADNDLTLIMGRLPVAQAGYIIAGPNPDMVLNPGGSSGTLCVGSPHARLTAQVTGSGPNGIATVVVDTTMMPTNPIQPIMAGQVWNFQFWYRDVLPNGQNTSNFSDAVAILFQ